MRHEASDGPSERCRQISDTLRRITRRRVQVAGSERLVATSAQPVLAVSSISPRSKFECRGRQLGDAQRFKQCKPVDHHSDRRRIRVSRSDGRQEAVAVRRGDVVVAPSRRTRTGPPRRDSRFGTGHAVCRRWHRSHCRRRQRPSIAGPVRRAPSSLPPFPHCGEVPPPIETRRRVLSGGKARDPDLVSPGFVGDIGDPMIIRRHLALRLVETRVEGQRLADTAFRVVNPEESLALAGSTRTLTMERPRLQEG